MKWIAEDNFLLISRKIASAFIYFLLFTFINTATADVVVERADEPKPAASAPTDPFWSLHEQLQQLQQEVQALRGLAEEQSHSIEQLDKQQKNNYSDLDQRLDALTKNGTPAATQQNAAPVTPNPQEFYDEKQRYQVAQQLVKDRKLPEAQKALVQFIKDFPKGSFTANAHYWLGEVDLVLPRPDVEQARYNFSYIVQNYPNHAKVPASLYKLGTIYDMKGQKQKATELFNQVIKQYPDSTAAQLAQRYLSN